jgi:hypothetical protein
MRAPARSFYLSLKDWFRLKPLWKLFLVCIFPIHAWAILMVLLDFEWIGNRSNILDSFGVAAYALVFALFESLLLFIASLAVSLLFPSSWDNKKRLAGMTWMILAITFWAVLAQLYFVLGGKVPAFYATWMIASGHPLWILIGTIFPFLLLSASVPLLLVLLREQFSSATLNLAERLGTLSMLYLFLDLFGFLFILYRNIFL